MMQDALRAAIRAEFTPSGLLASLTLEELLITGNSAVVRFSADHPILGHFRITLPIPQTVGDEVWQLYGDVADDRVSEWVRYGIAVPLLEAYETQGKSSPPGGGAPVDIHFNM